MININNDTTPADVINQLEHGSIKFADVEYHLKEKVLLLAAATYKGFCKIPREYHTPQAEILAAKSLAKSFYVPYAGGNYVQTALGLMDNGCDIRNVHPEYLNDEIIISSIKRGAIKEYKIRNWLLDYAKDKLSLAVCNALVSSSIVLFDGLEKAGVSIHSLSAGALCNGLMNDMGHGYILYQHGMTEILSLAIKNDRWPKLNIPMPTSLEDAIESRMATHFNDIDEAQWLNAFIANFSPLEVSNLLSTNARKKFLLEIFKPEQLVGVVKGDKDFNGYLLEHAMGL
jgi:hypothetical protein